MTMEMCNTDSGGRQTLHCAMESRLLWRRNDQVDFKLQTTYDWCVWRGWSFWSPHALRRSSHRLAVRRGILNTNTPWPSSRRWFATEFAKAPRKARELFEIGAWLSNFDNNYFGTCSSMGLAQLYNIHAIL